MKVDEFIIYESTIEGYNCSNGSRWMISVDCEDARMESLGLITGIVSLLLFLIPLLWQLFHNYKAKATSGISHISLLFWKASSSVIAYKAWLIFESYTDMNYERKSCEGLSLLMFFTIVAANLTYGLFILMATTNWLLFLRHFPWLAGSFGCVLFDIIVISQYYYYRDRRERERDSAVVDLIEDVDYDYD
ncbi:PQ loop repeat protein [Dictyocaulus viviparus]|uniref:PQ loop repeat protein n=1 Tax=Dictyocaulus viviparus TaxID=29172 RepID=A0A0D8XN89_DICVI|nr:PQ loop repeat protein [Dictyocaulus viviparus]